jgi:hypothetical protein
MCSQSLSSVNSSTILTTPVKPFTLKSFKDTRWAKIDIADPLNSKLHMFTLYLLLSLSEKQNAISTSLTQLITLSQQLTGYSFQLYYSFPMTCSSKLTSSANYVMFEICFVKHCEYVKIVMNFWRNMKTVVKRKLRQQLQNLSLILKSQLVFKIWTNYDTSNVVKIMKFTMGK